MGSETHRILVVGGWTRVDADAIAAASGRLADVGRLLGRLEWYATWAADHASCGTCVDPLSAGVAADTAARASRSIGLARGLVVELADSVAYAAALYAAAEGRASSLGWRSPLDIDFAADGPHPGGERFVEGRVRAMRELLPLVDPRGLDLVAAAVSFYFGVGDGLAGVRAQRDLAALSDALFDSALLAPSGRRALAGLDDRDSASAGRGIGARGSAGAAGMAASWAAALGEALFGRVRGVEVSGPALPADRRGIGAGRGPEVFGKTMVESPEPRPPVLLAPSPRVPAALSAATFALRFSGFRARPEGAILASGPLTPPAAPTPPVAPSRPMPAPTPVSASPTPLAPSSLLGELSGLREGGEEGQLKILRHETPAPDGTTSVSWSVVIRGTQDWGAGGPNPQDMLSNLQEVAGAESDQSRAVLAAMEMAGIGAGEPVEFVGHSQGGIVAARLATDATVRADYTVVSALTAGSPIAGSVPGGLPVLALENTRDLVPALDGASNAPGVVTVHFDGADLVAKDAGPLAAHDMGTYRALMEGIEGPAAAADPALAEVREWEEARIRGLGIDGRTRTETLVYDTRRIAGRG